MMRPKLITLFVLVPFIISACGPQTTQQAPFVAGSQVWIDAPLPGSQLPLAPVEIVAHAASSAGIASFSISLNSQPLASVNPDAGSIDPSMMYMRYNWEPSAAGTYLIEVQAMDQSGKPGPTAQVMVEIVESTSTPTETETQIPSPTFTPTETYTPSPSPTCGPLTFTPNINANCREGPGEGYSALDNPAMKGQAYPLDGRDEDSTWYRIMLTQYIGCWVAASLGTTSCDAGSLRVLATPTPMIVCRSFTDKTTCDIHNPPCEWKYTTLGPGFCKAK
jgi:hypothetical protein